MEAMIEKMNEVTVVHIKGRVDYETVEPFRRHLVGFLSKEKVVLSLKDLNFVGSIGIVEFVSAIAELYAANQMGVKMSSVGIEFRRLFEASDISGLQVYENLHLAMSSFYRSEIVPLPRLSPPAGVEDISVDEVCDLNPD